MTYGTDADFLKVPLCQVREDPLVDLVVAESRLVFFEAQAPQPAHNVHDGPQASLLQHSIVKAGRRGHCGEWPLSERALKGRRAFLGAFGLCVSRTRYCC